MPSIQNQGTGAGGSRTNLNGLRWEEKIYLKNWLEKHPDIKLEKIESKNRSNYFKILDKENILIGYYGRQNKLYSILKEHFDFEEKQRKVILSKKILPDSFILNLKTKTLYIFEKKWQQRSGSVDEKIQTAPFKIEMLQKVFDNFGIKVKYEYILSSWFNKEIYRNIREYYENNENVKVWIEDSNLNDLKIEDYLNKE